MSLRILGESQNTKSQLQEFACPEDGDCTILRNLGQGLKMVQELDKRHSDSQLTPILIQCTKVYNAVLFTFRCFRYSRFQVLVVRQLLVIYSCFSYDRFCKIEDSSDWFPKLRLYM